MLTLISTPQKNLTRKITFQTAQNNSDDQKTMLQVPGKCPKVRFGTTKRLPKGRFRNEKNYQFEQTR